MIDRLAAQLWTKCVGRDADVRVQQPVTIPLHGEPEPDLCVVAGDMDRFNERHPGPTDLMLVIEVANQSRSRDRRLKLQIYASASIPQYWIVNLHDNLVEVYTQPQPEQGAYRQRMDHSVSDVNPFTILGTELTLAVSEFLKLPQA